MPTQMSGSNERSELRLSATCVAIEGTGGPALAGSPNHGIAVAIAAPDGSPYGGLHANAFSVSAVASDRRRGTAARSVTIRDVTEPIPGVYFIELNADLASLIHHTLACVVDVQTDPADRGQRAASHSTFARVLVPIGR